MDYAKEIQKLKKEKNAVILAHYYQRSEVQDVADFLGDSYKLSVEASKTDADIIVFCGVHFMAETAKILSPNKKVILPVMEAGCPMANMINAKQLKEYKDAHPRAKVLCYVNSTAEVKALSDVCVTSSNAVKIIDIYKDEEILYCPDGNLAKYVIDRKGYTNIDPWKGHCCIHNDLKVSEIEEAKKAHPNALFVAHPEVNLDVLNMADYIGSTAQIIDYCKKSDAKEFIVGTEEGIIHKLKKDSPDKNFYLASNNLRCYDMKLTTLKDVYEALKDEKNLIEVDEETRLKAKKCLDKMIELS